ncbi:sulfonate ABC transporter ATP-binding protein [Oerskovia sp. Root918]|uniref:ABC transporter ATP-binding protein n=1 Tax=Oerskovia sp. Root918 TaxID=1736607 RepID=UPI0006F3B02A|nr:ABC transporter ATP-binding protein [Oerskovia sp. Root918]KRD42715.1 sulfonate ABC transporter ATP-binding protein [Oerskovia sp. Root918]
MSVRTVHDPAAPTVRVQDVTKSYGDRTILEDFSLTLRPGEFVALLGASGSGKTTLLRILAGLEEHDTGTVEAPAERTVVFQEPRLVASKRVGSNVILGQRSTRDRRAAASAALAEVGLGGREAAWPTTLSGGEAQRVALARALVRNPRLLLLDEPFAALDALTRIRMQALVAELCHEHQPAVLLVTHDVDEAILLADRVAVLQDGKVGVELEVPFDRPRRRGVPGFGDFRRRLLLELGVEEAIGTA